MDHMHCDPSHGISRKILGTEQERLRVDRSYARAIPHLSLCAEDAHSNQKGTILCYLDFQGAFFSTDHTQMAKVLEIMGLPIDFTRLVSNLYSKATTVFVTLHVHTPQVGAMRGAL